MRLNFQKAQTAFKQVSGKMRSRSCLEQQNKRAKGMFYTEAAGEYGEAKDMMGQMHPVLQEGLEENNINSMTNLQRDAINGGILQGQSMFLRAANGSGKTLACLLPVLNNLYQQKNGEGNRSRSSDDSTQRVLSK